MAIYGFFLSKKHDSFGFRKFLLESKREKSQKIENNDNKYFFSIF